MGQTRVGILTNGISGWVLISSRKPNSEPEGVSDNRSTLKSPRMSKLLQFGEFLSIVKNTLLNNSSEHEGGALGANNCALCSTQS